MYRVLASGLSCALTIAVTFHANASSIVALPDVTPETARSIIHLGDTAAPIMEARDAEGAILTSDEAGDGSILNLTASVLAVGPDAIPIAEEEVASIVVDEEPTQPAWIAQELSLTMRGGVVYDAPASAIDATEAPLQPETIEATTLQ